MDCTVEEEVDAARSPRSREALVSLVTVTVLYHLHRGRGTQTSHKSRGTDVVLVVPQLALKSAHSGLIWV